MHEPVIMTPHAACFSFTVNGTLPISYVSAPSRSTQTYSQRSVDHAVMEVHGDFEVDEYCRCQFSPMLRVVAMVMSNDNTSRPGVFHMVQNIGT